MLLPRWLALVALFVVGAALGLVVGVAMFCISFWRAARAVHAIGVVCRGEVVAIDDVIGPLLAGPALLRLSGAFEDQSTKGTDVLGIELRLQKPDHGSPNPRVGDQDLVFGTFQSFATAERDRAATDAGDYFGNFYDSVTPWWIPKFGPVRLQLAPPQSAVPRDRAPDRLGRLEVDIESKRARFILSADLKEVASVRLLERLSADAPALHVSMFRCGRGIRPLGFRNGIRATAYPFSQLGRRIRGH